MTAITSERQKRTQAAHLRELDWLMLVTVALCCLGLVMAVSVRGSHVDLGPMRVMKEQGSKVLAGLVAFMLAALVPLRLIRRWALPGFFVAALCCLLPRLLGDKVNGAYRWIEIGSFQFQPVEPARFCMVLAVASMLAKAGSGITAFRTGFLPAMGVALLLVGVLATQPDNGNALIVLGLAAVLSLVAGVRFLWFVPVGLLGLCGLSVMALQHDYVRERLTGFLDTRADSQVGLGLIAVGSGGLFGRGLGQGWMKMGYVPEAHNDFVFAIVAEEFGYFGSLFVLVAFTAFGVIVYRLVTRVRDPFLRYLVCGFGLMICFQAAANLLVVSGWAPAKGIDLPFVSTGGTSLMFCLAAVGLIGNAARADAAGGFATADVSPSSRVRPGVDA
ncbi:MAG: cell division protein FtsW [Planctomycetes bacterium]|nr:cell division protein FtsW [Planctomycetota bacterium]